MGGSIERNTFGVKRENCCVAAFHKVIDLRAGHWTDKEENYFKEGRRERRKSVQASVCASKFEKHVTSVIYCM